MHNPQESVITKVLNGNATPADIKQVIAWFATEEGQVYLSSYMNKEYEANGLPDKFHAPTILWKRILWKLNAWSAFFSSRNIRKIAAVLIPLLILAGSGCIINRYVDLLGTSEIRTITVAQGKDRTLTLPDGSQAYLGPGAKLSYPERFRLFSRNIQFSGEGYFNIAHQNHRPFRIQTGNVCIQVLGTSFNLMADASSSIVRLRLDKGLVRLQSSSGSTCDVRAGDNIVYDTRHNSFWRESPEQAEVCIDWRTGTMQFNDAPLEEVLRPLSAKFNVHFQIENPRLKSYRYTILWENASLETVLQDMSTITPLQITRKNNVIVLK